MIDPDPRPGCLSDEPPVDLDAATLDLVSRLREAVVVHRGARIVFANARAARMLGARDAAALLGTPWIDEGAGTAPPPGGCDSDDLLRDAVLPGGLAIRFSTLAVRYRGEPAWLTTFRCASGERRVIEELEASETRYRTLVDLCPEAVWVNIDGMLVFANSAAAELVGAARPQEIVGRSVFEILHPRYHEAIRERMKRVVDRAEVVGLLEEEVVRLDGSTVAVEITAGPVRFGDRMGLMAVARDISARKRAEASALAWRRNYETLLHASRALFYDRDLRTGSIQFAGNARALLGVSEQELGSDPERWASRLHPDDVERHRLEIDRVRDGADGLQIEYRIRRETGDWIVVEDEGALVRDASGAPERIVGVVADVTARHAAEVALRESEARARAILDAVPDGIVTLGEDGRIESMNPGAERILGSTASDGVGIAFPEFVPEVRVGEASAGSLPDALGRRFETRARRRDAREVPVLLSLDEVRLADRRIFLALLHDQTERKALEEQFRHAQKMEAVGRLAGGVAHDFNNLLLTVQGRTEMLLAGLPEPHPMRRQVEEIQAATERATHLTRQLLAFGRRQPLRPRLVDLNALVLDLADMLRRLIGEDVELSLSLEPALDRVRADPGVLDQVVMNLVLNARDAMPGGGRVAIETANVGESSHPRVSLCVRDTGVGMDEATRARIFEPYFTTKEPGRGTGLGLSTVDGIVRQSGGEIEVESARGRGSSFRVLLPRAEGDLEPPAPEPVEPARVGGGEALLLVEDDQAARELLVEFLEGRGYEVLAAGSAREALRLAESSGRGIRLLFTDLGLPDMRGTALAQELVASLPALRAVFVSGYTQETLGCAGMARERVRFLHKPFRLRDAEARIRELLDERAR
jgi:PAS domain S-box-containing protein